MNLFISWSGEVSCQVATILSAWLKKSLQFISPFISPEMRKGKNWRLDLANALSETDFGIICLTKDNLKSEWIHYEAGAISKNLSSTVFTFLYEVDPSEIVDPLDSYNHTIFAKDDFRKLFLNLYNVGYKNGLTTLTEIEANDNFNDRWPDLEEKLVAIPKHYKNIPPVKKEKDILLEILQNVKALNMNIPGPTIVKESASNYGESIVNIIICNIEVVDSNKLEFDIYLHNNSLQNLSLQTFQIGLDLSHDFIGTGVITVDVIEGSCHCLPREYSLHKNILYNQEKNHLRLTAKTGIGSNNAVLINSAFPGSKYCSICLQTDILFGNSKPDFKLNFVNDSGKTRTAVSVFKDGKNTGTVVNFNHFVFDKNNFH